MSEKMGNFIKIYNKGEIIGLKSILLNSANSRDYIAKCKCVCYSLSFESLCAIIGDNFKGVIYMMAIKTAFRNSLLLNKFEESLIDKTYPAFYIKVFNRDDVVVSAGSLKNDKLIIIIEGSVYQVYIY